VPQLSVIGYRPTNNFLRIKDTRFIFATGLFINHQLLAIDVDRATHQRGSVHLHSRSRQQHCRIHKPFHFIKWCGNAFKGHLQHLVFFLKNMGRARGTGRHLHRWSNLALVIRIGPAISKRGKRTTSMADRNRFAGLSGISDNPKQPVRKPIRPSDNSPLSLFFSFQQRFQCGKRLMREIRIRRFRG